MMKKTVSHEQILIKRDGGLKPVVASALPCGVTAVFRVFIARIYGAYDGVFRLRADEDFGKHGGVTVPQIQVGGLGGAPNRKVVFQNITLDDPDVETLEYLKGKGADIIFQTIPEDTPMKLDDILKRYK